MSLKDIAGLVAAWPTGKCQSPQARLRAYVAAPAQPWFASRR